mmetsp:Transcript_14324/g.26809  ORF Transcript_14324/g.26809 Transcript_14324/m.26809 type:complete len:109 (-) Transcript_14324:1482-1808(-)
MTPLLCKLKLSVLLLSPITYQSADSYAKPTPEKPLKRPQQSQHHSCHHDVWHRPPPLHRTPPPQELQGNPSYLTTRSSPIALGSRVDQKDQQCNRTSDTAHWMSAATT